MTPSLDNLLIVPAIAFAAPLLLGLLPRLVLPSVIVEIGAGIVLGPSVLGLVEVDAAVEVIALIGLAFVLFLAGLELELERLLCSTSLGVLVPVLEDSGEIGTPLGQLIVAGAAIADFGAIVLLRGRPAPAAVTSA